jgi:hypothetical protein
MTDKQLKSILDYFRYPDSIDGYTLYIKEDVTINVNTLYKNGYLIHMNPLADGTLFYITVKNDINTSDKIYEEHILGKEDIFNEFRDHIRKLKAEEIEYKKQEFNKLIGFDGE